MKLQELNGRNADPIWMYERWVEKKEHETFQNNKEQEDWLDWFGLKLKWGLGVMLWKRNRENEIYSTFMASWNISNFGWLHFSKYNTIQ